MTTKVNEEELLYMRPVASAIEACEVKLYDAICRRLGNKVRGVSLRPATAAESIEIASLFSSREKEKYKVFLKGLEDHEFLTATAILPVAEGYFLHDNPEIRDGKIHMNPKELASRVNQRHSGHQAYFSSKDRKIRFVPGEFKQGELLYGEIENHRFLTALMDGNAGVSFLNELASHTSSQDYDLTLDLPRAPCGRKSSLISFSLNYGTGPIEIQAYQPSEIDSSKTQFYGLLTSKA